MATFTTTTARTTDSTDRLPALGTAKPASAQPAKAPTASTGVVRKLLNTLMRALANPHV